MPNNQGVGVDDLDFNLLCNITERLAVDDAIAFFMTNKNLYAMYTNASLWQNKFGCHDYQEFNRRYKALTYPLLREGVQRGYVTLEHAEETKKMLDHMDSTANAFKEKHGYLFYSVPHSLMVELREQCIKRYRNSLTDEDYQDSRSLIDSVGLSDEEFRGKVVNVLTEGKLDEFQHVAMKYLPRFNVIIALREGLYSIEHLREFPNAINFHQVVLRDNGIRLLREKLFTLDQLFHIDQHGLESLLSEQGDIAIHTGLITPDQAMRLNEKLYYLLNGKAWMAFRNGVITSEQAIKMNNEIFKIFGNEKMWDLLIQRKLTADDIINLHDHHMMDYVFSIYLTHYNRFGAVHNHIPIMIERGLITLEQLIAIKNMDALDEPIKKYGDIKLLTGERLVEMANLLKSKLPNDNNQKPVQQEELLRKNERVIEADMPRHVPLPPKLTLNFSDFKRAYLTKYQSELFKKKSEMHIALMSGKIKSIEQVEDYVRRNPNSRSEVIYNKLASQLKTDAEKSPEHVKPRKPK